MVIWWLTKQPPQVININSAINYSHRLSTTSTQNDNAVLIWIECRGVCRICQDGGHNDATETLLRSYHHGCQFISLLFLSSVDTPDRLPSSKFEGSLILLQQLHVDILLQDFMPDLSLNFIMSSLFAAFCHDGSPVHHYTREKVPHN